MLLTTGTIGIGAIGTIVGANVDCGNGVPSAFMTAVANVGQQHPQIEMANSKRRK
jgi:hypothetical protein